MVRAQLFVASALFGLASIALCSAVPTTASAQTVVVEGQVDYSNPPPGYGNPPPGYGQPQQQPQPQPQPQQPYYAPTYQQPAPQIRYVDRETDIKALWITGAALFGATYVLGSSLGQLGLSGDYALWMFIPLVGPWAALGYANNDDEIAFSLIAGIGQAAGLTMFILGMTLRRTVRVAVRAINESDERSPTLALDLLPTPGGAQLGMTLTHF